MSEQTLNFEYDQDAPLNVEETGRETKNDVLVRDITFEGPEKKRIAAYIVLPPADAPSTPHAGIVWVHWFEPEAHNSNRTQFLDEAITLAQEGTISVLPDAFWAMTPKQWAANPGYEWKTEFEHDRDLSIRQVNEHRRAIDLLLMQAGIDHERIAFVGHDFGAMYGAIVAGLEQRVKAYVLMAGTYSFSDWFMYGSDLSKEEQQAYIDKMKALDPTEWIKKSDAKLYFQFAHSDYYVPERAAQVFYNAASEPKEIAWYEAQHDLKDIENASGRDRLNWLRDVLGLGTQSSKQPPAGSTDV